MAEEEKKEPPSRLAAVLNLDFIGLKNLNRRADEVVPLTTTPDQETGQDQAASLRHQEL